MEQIVDLLINISKQLDELPQQIAKAVVLAIVAANRVPIQVPKEPKEDVKKSWSWT